jgi:pimeloyl-ACP methyl ester carboxylesterase/DNA-binding CsgD family transcriptional regulator
MEPPPVRYLKTRDGISIAYSVCGQGTPLIFLPGTFDHVQLAWEYPGLREWLHLLAERFRLIQYDPRGTGMSGRNLSADHSADDYQLDLEALVEHLELESFVLFGVAPGMRVAVRYAHDNPERIAAFICAAAGVTSRITALFQILPGQDWDVFLKSVTPRDLDAEDARMRIQLTKRAYSLEDFVRKMRASTAGRTGAYLAGLHVPVLVLHPRDYVLLAAEQAAEVAELARGSMVLIDGSSAFGDPEQGVREIERFLARLDGPSSPTAPVAGGLTARELEVLRLLTAGRTNQQIADELVISLNTVYRHVNHIYAKTGVANRAEAASYAHLHSLL